MTHSKDPRKTFGEALVEVAEKNQDVIALSADSSSGSGMGPFKERFPERHIEFGVMEQGMIGFAAGLASTGKVPFAAAIAPFVTARPFEMVRNDLGYMHQNVKVVGRCAGFTYSTLGPTHYSLEDIAIMRTIPGMTVLVPGDPVEVKKAVHAAVRHVGPLYLRIGNPPMPILFDEDHHFEIGRGVVVRQGSDLAIIAAGTVLSNALDAARILEADGIQTHVINIHTMKPLDRDIIITAAEKTGRMMTVEEHYLIGGLGSAVAEVLSEASPTPMKRIGVPDIYATNGPYWKLQERYGLLPEQIADAAMSFLMETA